ncbi:uncharacterized protein LOC132203011 [Neocloeon triangulifer]|uniref:uncharacterized protein LOC132203011 n=1 Tax=Neocloeon triangulifer TaxID=2078957 RepID=UPI00286F262E|nr:uncharacterized protein LOC132203011 [Neocloeon triangulifer]XP_059486408.1 uncharacterized protein LOC132203011 [Neocloeon triangulifer]
MTAAWLFISMAGLVGLAGAYEGRSLTRDTAWWSAPEPQWRSRILPALLPASRYWGNPPAQHQQQPYHNQNNQQPYANQQYQAQPFDNQQRQAQPYASQQYQAQPYHGQQVQNFHQQQPSPFLQAVQAPRSRYLREPLPGDVYGSYNPRQPAPWSVQVGTSLTVRDDDSRGAFSNRRHYVQSENEGRWAGK